MISFSGTTDNMAFVEDEDHYALDPKDGSLLFTFGDCKNISRNGDSSMSSVEQMPGAKSYVPDTNLEDHSNSDTKEDVSAVGFDLDTWADLPNLSPTLISEYNEGNYLDSFTKELMNDLSDVPTLDSVRAADTMQQDGEPEVLSNEHADKACNIFLDCYWANIGDYDDLDEFLRNDESIFVDEMIVDEDVFLSSSADEISSTVHTIPFPDLPLYNDQPSDQSCSHSQLDECSDGKENHLQKVKMDGQEGFLGVQKNAETWGKNKPPQNFSSGCWEQNSKQQISHLTLHTSGTNDLHSCQSESVGLFCPSSHVLQNEYGYPPYFSTFPRIQDERDQRHPNPLSDNLFPDPLKYLKSSGEMPDFSRPVAMTPQEKIEKLRRRQQMQAMHAIQKQKQQYGCQITCSDTEDSASQACSQKNQSQAAITNITGFGQCANKLRSLKNILLEEKNEPERVSMLIDHNSLEETIYYQLQESLEKLDTSIRLRIRDSLYRLAGSALERQRTSGRSSTNRSVRDTNTDGETNKQDRPESSHDSETVSNPIDRIVAHLLFYQPPESCVNSSKVPRCCFTIPRNLV